MTLTVVSCVCGFVPPTSTHADDCPVFSTAAADDAMTESKHHAESPTPAGEIDAVNHPRHYTAHPSGVECITVTEHMGFCIGNAVKYLWRADLKGSAVEDLRKAAWYIEREIDRRTR